MKIIYARRSLIAIFAVPLIFAGLLFGIGQVQSQDAKDKEKPRPFFTPIPINASQPPDQSSTNPGLKQPGGRTAPATQTKVRTQPLRKATPPPQKPQGDQPTPVPDFAPEGLPLFYIAQRGGEIEPCGCVKNQLGGIQYEAEYYTDLPDDKSLRVDVGGWGGSPMNPESVMKTGYALQAMAGYLDFDAVNVSGQDLMLGKAYFEDLNEKQPDSLEPLISSNVYFAGETKSLAFPSHRVVEKVNAKGEAVKVGIVGLTSSQSLRSPGAGGANKDYEIGDYRTSLKPAIDALKKSETDVNILLFHGRWDEIARMAVEFPEINVVVIPWVTPNRIGTERIGETIVFSSHGSLGKYLGRADLIQAEAGNWLEAKHKADQLGISPKVLPAHKEMVALIDNYKKNTKDLLIERPRNPKRTFAGARMCASCHMTEYKDWESTHHAHAMETLISKNSQFDPNCIKCHVVGFKKDNGFYNISESRNMAGVQCENCHGPALDHAMKENMIRNRSIDRLSEDEKQKFLAEAKALIPPKEVPESVCIQCHYGENDPHFIYDEKIHKVDHRTETAVMRDLKAFADESEAAAAQ